MDNLTVREVLQEAAIFAFRYRSNNPTEVTVPYLRKDGEQALTSDGDRIYVECKFTFVTVNDNKYQHTVDLIKNLIESNDKPIT